MDAERASLEAAIQRFNTNYNPTGGPPQRDLPRLISPISRRAGTPPTLPPKESKYGVFDDLSAEFIDLAVYNPTQTETVFQKMRWVYTGQEPFEDYVHRMGSSARSLAVGDICFKNTLYQSIKPPCTLFIIDMEPSAEAYIFMDKRQYAEAINDL